MGQAFRISRVWAKSNSENDATVAPEKGWATQECFEPTMIGYSWVVVGLGATTSASSGPDKYRSHLPHHATTIMNLWKPCRLGSKEAEGKVLTWLNFHARPSASNLSQAQNHFLVLPAYKTHSGTTPPSLKSLGFGSGLLDTGLPGNIDSFAD